MSKPITIELRKRCAMEAFQEWLDRRQLGYHIFDINVAFQEWLDRRQPGFALIEVGMAITMVVDDKRDLKQPQE
jgi:hypothetical protein